MSYEFDAQLTMSREGFKEARTALFRYFQQPSDWEFDSTPSERRYGNDIHIVAHGCRYRIEQKHRRAEIVKFHGRIELLEDVSKDTTGSKGWTWTAGKCEFILFTHEGSRKFSMWPGPQLQFAWQDNRDEWVKKYGITPAQNDGFRTLNVQVPTQVLREALYRNGSPRCPYCGRNVGVFYTACRCGALRSCCAWRGMAWSCSRCDGSGQQ